MNKLFQKPQYIRYKLIETKNSQISSLYHKSGNRNDQKNTECFKLKFHKNNVNSRKFNPSTK